MEARAEGSRRRVFRRAEKSRRRVFRGAERSRRRVFRGTGGVITRYRHVYTRGSQRHRAV